MSRLKAKKPEDVKQGKAKGLIFGASGVGKTWFSLCFPSPYYIDTEGGADLEHYQKRLAASGGVYLGPEEGALDFDTVLDQMKALATEKHGYKTLVIDSITKLYQTAIANEAERLGDKDAFGASKKKPINQMRRLVNWAMRLDMNIWFIAHEITEWGVNSKTQTREEIGKMPDVWDKLVYELDIGLRIIRRGKEYPATALVHKSRLENFLLADTFNLDYKDFALKYGEEAISGEVQSVVLASQEQVKQITELMSIRIDAETLTEKLLTKASADTWADLTETQATSTIEWLKKGSK